MKKTKQLTVIVALGLLAFASSNLQASINTVSISGKVTVQNPTTTHGDVDTDTTKTMSFNTQDILNLIAVADGKSFPPGSKLVFDTDTGDFLVQDKDGTTLDDVTGDFTVDESDSVSKGKFDNATGAEKFNDLFVSTITFDDGNGNTFTFTGVTKVTFSQTKADKDGNAKVADSTTTTGAGTADVNGDFGIITGTISSKGKEVVAVP